MLLLLPDELLVQILLLAYWRWSDYHTVDASVITFPVRRICRRLTGLWDGRLASIERMRWTRYRNLVFSSRHIFNHICNAMSNEVFFRKIYGSGLAFGNIGVYSRYDSNYIVSLASPPKLIRTGKIVQHGGTVACVTDVDCVLGTHYARTAHIVSIEDFMGTAPTIDSLLAISNCFDCNVGPNNTVLSLINVRTTKPFALVCYRGTDYTEAWRTTPIDVDASGYIPIIVEAVQAHTYMWLRVRSRSLCTLCVSTIDDNTLLFKSKFPTNDVTGVGCMPDGGYMISEGNTVVRLYVDGITVTRYDRCLGPKFVTLDDGRLGIDPIRYYTSVTSGGTILVARKLENEIEYSYF
jgi:hypothetical protein